MAGPVRRTAVAVLAVLLLGLPAGCGSQEDGYCSALRTEQKTLDSLANKAAANQGDVITPTLAAFERLRAAAPNELRDEWDTVVFAYRGLVAEVHRTGVDPAHYRPGSRPAGLTPGQANDLAATAAKLGSPEVLDAARGIETHANAVCKVKIGV